jgi:hypothetical protein
MCDVAKRMHRCLEDFRLSLSVFEGVQFHDRDDLVVCFTAAATKCPRFASALLHQIILVEHHVTIARGDLHGFLRGNRFTGLCFDSLAAALWHDKLDGIVMSVQDKVMLAPALPEEKCQPTPLASPQQSIASQPADNDAERSFPTDEDNSVLETVTPLVAHFNECIDELVGGLGTDNVLSSAARTAVRLAATDIRALPSSAARPSQIQQHLERAVMAMLCLRLLSPRLLANTSPAPRSPEHQRRLMLFTKLLQKMANRAQFDSSPTALSTGGSTFSSQRSLSPMSTPSMTTNSPQFLAGFNDFVSSHSDAVVSALMNCSGIDSEPSTDQPIECACDTNEALTANDTRFAAIFQSNLRPVITAFQRLSPATPNADLWLLWKMDFWRQGSGELVKAVDAAAKPKEKSFLSTLFGSPNRNVVRASEAGVSIIDAAGVTPEFAELYLHGCRIIDETPYPIGSNASSHIFAAIALAGNCVIVSEEALGTAQQWFEVHHVSSSIHPHDSHVLQNTVQGELTTPRSATPPPAHCDGPPSQSPSRKGPAYDVTVAVILARLWTWFRGGERERFTVIFLAQSATPQTEKKRWSLSWLMKVLERMPDCFVDAVEQVLHVRSSLVTRVLQSGRRFSLSKSRLDNKVVAKDELDDAALTAAKASTVIPVPPEYLVPPQFSTSMPLDAFGAAEDTTRGDMAVVVRRRLELVELLHTVATTVTPHDVEACRLDEWDTRDRQSKARIHDELLFSDVKLSDLRRCVLNLPLLGLGQPLFRTLVDQFLIAREKLFASPLGVFDADGLRVVFKADQSLSDDAWRALFRSAPHMVRSTFLRTARAIAMRTTPEAAQRSTLVALLFSTAAQTGPTLLADLDMTPEQRGVLLDAVVSAVLRIELPHCMSIPIDVWP